MRHFQLPYRTIALSLAVLVPLSIVTRVARAQVLECGAHIVSNQPFEGQQRLCLFIPDTRDRTRVVLRPCSPTTSNPGFLWKIVRRDGGGMYILSAQTGQDRRLEVENFSHSDGAAIQIWGPNALDGYRSQTWDFLPGPAGARIISVESGKCLNVPLGRNRLDQEVLQQFTCAGAPNDTWRIEPVLGPGCR